MAAEGAGRSITTNSRRPKIRHQYYLHREATWPRGDTAGCTISRRSLGSGWRKASEPRGKMAWPWCYGDLVMQHKSYLSFLFILTFY